MADSNENDSPEIPPPPSPERQREIIGFFARHLVSIWYVIDGVDAGGNPKPGEINWFIGSGFVLEIHGHWMLITAGHVIHQLDEAEARGGLLECRPVDTFGSEARFKNPLFLNYGRLKRGNIGYIGIEERETGMDYGFIAIDDLTRAGLEANNIVPVRDQNWRMSEGYRDRFLMVGTPATGVIAPRIGVGGRPVLRGVNAVVIVLLPEPNPPECIVKDFERIYLRVPGTQHIGGMSGGPVLGLKIGEQCSYKPVGIQSGWSEKHRVAAICPLGIFADWVQRSIEEVLRELDVDKSSQASE